MCVIFVAFQKSHQYPLILAANRDEYYQRPTAAAEFWDDHPNTLAGRDLEGQGTWLGISRTGRIAAITNHLDSGSNQEPLRSRGEIVSTFLQSNHSVDQYSKQLNQHRDEYNGYSILFGDYSQLRYQSNCSHLATYLDSGIHALSNSFINSPWTRVLVGKELLASHLENDETVRPDRIFEILSDQSSYESIHSKTSLRSANSAHSKDIPIFIKARNYGTRSSTVVLIDRQLNVYFEERTFGENSRVCQSQRQFNFQLSGLTSSFKAAGGGRESPGPNL